MPRCGTYHVHWIRRPAVFLAMVAAGSIAGSCGRAAERNSAPSDNAAVLRVGVAQLSATAHIDGLRQVEQILAVEGLLRPGEDGRMLPWLAESWAVSSNGHTITIKLRPHVTFHDGSPVDAATVARLLPGALESFMGPLFSEVRSVTARGDDAVEIDLDSPSPFLVEALEAPIQEPGPEVVGTGAFSAVPGSVAEMRGNADYYLGRPALDRIHVETFPSIRSAWADMLRGQLDMLWEVGGDALDSLEQSSTVSVFTFTRRYQHVLAFNTKAAALRSPEVRRALNLAIDRTQVVESALQGHGVPSAGPVWPQHWTVQGNERHFGYDPREAADLLMRAGYRRTPLRFTCLVSADSVDERIALEVKRQLSQVGADMAVQEGSPDEINQRAVAGNIEAAVFEVVSGPTLFRPYLVWHSKTPLSWAGFGNATVDAALDKLRNVANDNAYRSAIGDLQQAFMDDPPAIFLAWSVRARAVSKRFNVPSAEPGRDILSTLRLWTPVADERRASRN